MSGGETRNEGEALSIISKGTRIVLLKSDITNVVASRETLFNCRPNQRQRAVAIEHMTVTIQGLAEPRPDAERNSSRASSGNANTPHHDCIFSRGVICEDSPRIFVLGRRAVTAQIVVACLA
jgi:hypothetical protein